MAVRYPLLAALCCLCLAPLSGRAADTVAFREAEDSLRTLAGRITAPSGEAQRLENNARFRDLFEQVLLREGSFSHPFDSLPTVSLLRSPDNRFRVITWYVPLPGQRFRYFGFLQRGDCTEGRQKLYVLNDASGHLNGKRAGELEPSQWYGAFYYDLVHTIHEGENLYTLLGWKGDSPLIRKRVIEPLHFAGGEPVFGKAVFDSFPGHDPWRIVFAYSARVSMSLQHERGFFRTSDGARDMIVFDRLVPQASGQEGHYQFYVPEANVFDGLYFHDGRWLFVPDLDARLPEPRE